MKLDFAVLTTGIVKSGFPSVCSSMRRSNAISFRLLVTVALKYRFLFKVVVSNISFLVWIVLNFFLLSSLADLGKETWVKSRGILFPEFPKLKMYCARDVNWV